MPSVLHRTTRVARAVLQHPGKLRVKANLQGKTQHFSVYVDPSLGTGGKHIAQVVRDTCDADYAKISRYFGGIPTRAFNVILFSYPNGAYHNTCAARDLFCDAQIHPAPNGAYSEFLNVAEFVEVFESVQGRGWACGKSNGEGLSRVLATELYPDQLDGFATAASWLDSRRENFVDRNHPTDGSMVANGCAALFLNWLHHQLGYSWHEIVGAGGPTLGKTYTRLTGKEDGFAQFRAVLNTRFPRGKKSGLKTDNPFPI